MDGSFCLLPRARALANCCSNESEKIAVSGPARAPIQTYATIGAMPRLTLASYTIFGSGDPYLSSTQAVLLTSLEIAPEESNGAWKYHLTYCTLTGTMNTDKGVSSGTIYAGYAGDVDGPSADSAFQTPGRIQFRIRSGSPVGTPSRTSVKLD